MTLGVSEKQKDLILKVVASVFPDVEILLFGSRQRGNHKITSDLDLCLKGKDKLDLSKWAQLDELFTSSDLVFKVDLVDWHRITPEFQNIILKNCTQITRS